MGLLDKSTGRKQANLSGTGVLQLGDHGFHIDQALCYARALMYRSASIQIGPGPPPKQQ
jgi:hypothetical protein